MADRLLGILRHQALELRFGLLVLEMGRPCPRKDRRKLRPSVRRGHINNTDCLDPGFRRVDAEKGRGLSAFDTAPELPLGRDDQMLIERIGMGLDLDPFAAAGNDREHRPPGGDDPHIVLQLGRILLGSRLFRERPRQHEFSFEHRAACLDAAVESSSHPAEARMPNVLLHIRNDLPGIGLVPAAVQLFRGCSSWTTRLPERSSGSASPRFSRHSRSQGGLVLAHDDPGVGAADEVAPIGTFCGPV